MTGSLGDYLRCWVSDLRRLDGGMFMNSRYFATVRRATWMPCSLRISAILLSLIGLVGGSASTIFLIIERMAVAEQAPPSTVPTWLEKKYFSSNTPRGVSMYLLVVTREMVDSCMPTASATSCSTSGFMASGPWSKNARCRSTMVRDTLGSDSLRLARLL